MRCLAAAEAKPLAAAALAAESGLAATARGKQCLAAAEAQRLAGEALEVKAGLAGGSGAELALPGGCGG